MANKQSDNNGWISLHRKILDWEWWDDINTSRLFIYLLLKANHEKKKWRGIEIDRGQLITGLHSLQKGTGISIRSIRTSLKRLKSTSELTSKTTNKFSLITITRYDDYQGEEGRTTSKTTSKVTNKRQTNDKQTTTNNNYNKERSKEIEQEAKIIMVIYNALNGKKTKSFRSFIKNMAYWRQDYDLRDIAKAIAGIRHHEFWSEKMSLDMLFRQRNPSGEKVDYIAQLLNMPIKEPSHDFELKNIDQYIDGAKRAIDGSLSKK